MKKFLSFNLIIMVMGAEEIIVYAIVFVGLFIIGGLIGIASLPVFAGRFFISGFLVAVFGTGAGTLFIKAVVHH
jgi:hypothetical protein